MLIHTQQCDSSGSMVRITNHGLNALDDLLSSTLLSQLNCHQIAYCLSIHFSINDFSPLSSRNTLVVLKITRLLVSKMKISGMSPNHSIFDCGQFNIEDTRTLKLQVPLNSLLSMNLQLCA